MPEPPPEDVKKIQEFLPDNRKTADVILRDVQYGVGKIIVVVKRVHEGD